MKNRRNVVVAFLLVAALLLGVGYAALSDTLTINGTAVVGVDNAEEVFNEDVYFSAVSAVTRNSTNTAIVPTGTATAVITSDNDVGTITIPDGVLMATGDSITVTYTILNAGDLDASVAVPTITNDNTTYFTVATNWGNAAKDLAAGDTIDVTVTITLNQTPVEAQNAEFKIEFVATSNDAL